MTTLAAGPDLLRLLAVPAFAWAAWRDVHTRRVPNRAWPPLLALGVAALAWEAWTVWTGRVLGAPRLFALRVAISVGLVVSLSYAFWRLGGFGGADAKALIVLAVLLPTFPTYYLPGTALPLVVPTLGVFSLTVLSNAVVLGAAYPFVLAARNALGGTFALAMFVGRPVSWERVPGTHGRLLETPGGFTRGGLDLDALRMYLNWRDATLSDLRAAPARHRDPASLPDDPDPPGDGRVRADGGESDPAPPGESGGVHAGDGEGDEAGECADPWGAGAFLEDVEHGAYGTSPGQLRDGLEVLATAERVWITPGIPFLVPTFAGLVVGLTYGDLLYALLGSVGIT